jgi:hypothetical protein
LKILHIWDQAAVACTLVKYQRKLGHEALVVKRKGYDPFGIMKFYNEKIWNVKFNKIFSWLAIKKAKEYDIIHIHDQFRLASSLKDKYPEKKIILHYHGSILRLTPRKILEKYERKVDCILVSTPDLLDFVDAIYLPNPIDVEHFHARKIKTNGKAISIMSRLESQNDLKQLLNLNKISLNVEYLNRESKPIEYSDMPDFLSKFEYLIDLKLVYGNKAMPAYGCLGLQGLHLGLKVLNYKFEIENHFPNQHDPKMVAKKIMEIYESI